ncbi:hypothetical protein CPAR01_00005 [Colletotrichum paranaense]|nr:uncharacterized protein CPAR01_00005 [Colletotrichum paranaense]KAK1546038.1 hypothetical protein CPAR01_00005 [Colletotrichum paranaense]
MEVLSKASRVATSKTAQRTIVNASLLVGTSLFLLPFAAIASILFFRDYLPEQVVTTPVHLQYGSGANPFGTATIPTSALRSQQEYDVSVTLSMPRSPANTQRGNFMIAIHLLDVGALSTGSNKIQPHIAPEPYAHFDGKTVLLSSRRPALVPYQDPMVSTASRILFLAYHVLFSDSETCVLTVPMAERVELARGSSLPASAYLELQGGQDIETYSASITLTAQLRGLRWLMYNYRVMTLTAAVLVFWASEIIFMAVAWLAWSGLSGSSQGSGIGNGGIVEKSYNKSMGQAKREEGSGIDELSDAPRTFPTYGNQAPLRYEPEVKDEQHAGPRVEDLLPLGGEADDEEEDDGRGFRGDSGIGTSYTEGDGCAFAYLTGDGEAPERWYGAKGTILSLPCPPTPPAAAAIVLSLVPTSTTSRCSQQYSGKPSDRRIVTGDRGALRRFSFLARTAALLRALVRFATMPCFKGIAVSIHANGAPLPEHGMQKQSRLSRISTYIPVPQPSINPDSNKPEPAKFAISITLLTPGLPIPYSTPKSTETNPYPKPQFVGGLPTAAQGPSKFSGVVNPYIPMTNSENETIAAYIYFDGRSKEEVATLLRPGEETWVNSRWVQVPDSEGGGLAEREFLFREVGLERWLNGLDLQGHDAAEKLERRRQKFEKRRRRQKTTTGATSMQVEEGPNGPRDTLRYGAEDGSPVEAVFGEDDSDSLSDDDEIPEATGQIKVLMFRVLASGEIKKGEYSPQFDAHDDDDDAESGKQGNGKSGVDADVEHTTSFAKPKTLDPKTISTQTVTGIDGPDKPYASFTFFYRGERQLQKIGIIASSKAAQATPGSAKRRSGQLDFSSLGPLKTSGTVGFSAFRDQDTEATRRRKARKKSNGNIGGALNDDSDDDDDESELLGKMQDIDEKDINNKLAPEDVRSQGELADGVNRIRLKRAHSAEPDRSENAGATNNSVNSGAFGNPLIGAASAAGNGHVSEGVNQDPSNDATIEGTVGSPLKKHRPSISGGDDQIRAQSNNSGLSDVMNRGVPTQTNAPATSGTNVDEEEL